MHLSRAMKILIDASFYLAAEQNFNKRVNLSCLRQQNYGQLSNGNF